MNQVKQPETERQAFERLYPRLAALTPKPETREEEHERRTREGRISFLSAGAARKR